MSNIAALAAALAAGGLSDLAIGKAFGTGAPQPAVKRENRGGKAFKAFSAAVSRALPQSRTASLDAGAALRAAGLKATPDDWHAARLATAGIAAALGAAVGAAASPTAAGTFFGAAVGLAAGVAAPPLWLSGKTQERRRQIRSSLPNVLELLSVAIGAGLTPERSIRLVSARAEGPLADEFAAADADIAMLGYTLPEALGNLARRVEVPQVSMFAAAVSLAAEQGSSIGAVIESQAESARGAYFKELEEKANKLPTKMIVPMIFLILPSLFILTFTPLVLTLIDTL